jgi:hypothetical protein
MARGEEIPVNPQMVAWARNRAGLTIEEAAEKFTHIAAWDWHVIPDLPAA